MFDPVPPLDEEELEDEEEVLLADEDELLDEDELALLAELELLLEALELLEELPARRLHRYAAMSVAQLPVQALGLVEGMELLIKLANPASVLAFVKLLTLKGMAPVNTPLPLST